jgi:hypothetical protein
MGQRSRSVGTLEDVPVNIKLKLSALWIAATLCYAYADILAFYQPGVLDAAAAGKMGPLGDVTQGILAGVAAFMAIPAIMAALCLTLSPGANRWFNIVAGVVYTLVIVLTGWTATYWYYRIFGAVEIVLTVSVIWLAWRWPRTSARG